jgi:hypothetical protein
MASYALHFQATGRDVGGKRVEEKFDLGRAPHFFQEKPKARWASFTKTFLSRHVSAYR